MQFVIQHSYLIPLLPLLGALAAGLLGAKYLKQKSHWPIWLGVGAAAVMAMVLLVGMLATPTIIPAAPPLKNPELASLQAERLMAFSSHWFDWIVAGDASDPSADKALGGAQFSAAAGAFIDPLTAVMLTVVCGIGFLITVFAAGYMKGEAGYFRFFCYLGLFIFAMTCLVMADNLIMLYLGWEGVGVCSYLLIGYYYDKPAAREAAKKAFIVNRIGDFGFAIGIFLIFYAFGTVSYFGSHFSDGVGGAHIGFLEMALHPAQYVPGDKLWVLNWIPFCLMLGAFGKSAQFPLYVWLPDAMEGPTPVSALIHAATMVTAGVYMIVRLGTLFVGHPMAMWTIMVIGAFTAIFAATIALKQNDLKKVFAYSTVSQLGYMFVAVGVLSPVAAVFHLVTHAFFKALLFLSSGVVMHATGGELDLRKMSGLKRVLPKTNILMLIGCLALAGFPLLAGFWSKDLIVSAALGKSSLLWGVLILTSLFTAYYTFRLYFRVFQGPFVMPSDSAGHHDSEHAASAGHTHHEHNHEPLVMMLPLAILAIGALLAGVINLPFAAGGVQANALADFLSRSPSVAMALESASQAYGIDPADPHAVSPAGFGVISNKAAFEVAPLVVGGAVALLGIGLAYWLHLHNRRKGEQMAEQFAGAGRLIEAKYWVDEIYQAAIVGPLRVAGRVLAWIDQFIIDGAVFAVGFLPQLSGYTLKRTAQRGYLQGYALSMMLGLAIILLWVFA